MRRHLLASSLALAALAPRAPAQDAIETRVAALMSRVSAAALERTVRDLAGFGTRNVRSATDRDDFGTGAARRYLEAKLAGFAADSGGRLEVEAKSYRVQSRRARGELEIVNIVATLRGTSDPERLYVVGGHYDSINARRDADNPAPGANDDASGTAAVVEACRVMSRESWPATIVFVCYDGEELGLLGSTEHARELAAAEARVDGMITNDIVGNTLGMDGKRRRDYLRCFSYAPRGADSFGRSLARAATFAARRHSPGLEVRMVFRGDRYGRGGDHRPFFTEGFPAVRFTEPREDYSRQHQDVTERDGKPYGDVPDYVDFEYLARVCRLNVALLAELASAPPPPGSVRVGGSRRAYDTIVQLAPRDGVGLEAVWRLTTSPDWEHALVLDPSAMQTRRGRAVWTLPDVCLDDVVVGVRAVGPDGSRSRATTPPDPDAFYSRTSGERGGRGRDR